MRKLIGIAALTVLGLTALPAHAADTTGTVLVPTGIAPRAQRCAYTLFEDQGTVGWTLSVAPGASFTLTAFGDNAALQDLDITFYQVLTSCEEDSVTTAVEHVNVEGDEAGTVPADAGAAIVHLFTGGDASFNYDETVA